MNLNEDDTLLLKDPGFLELVLEEYERLHRVPPLPESFVRTPVASVGTEAPPLRIASRPAACREEGARQAPRSFSLSLSLGVALVIVVLVVVLPRTAAAPPTRVPSKTASQVLLRISQLDPGQYADQMQYETWADSTCSTAAMTEVINAYRSLAHKHPYRIADILVTEAATGSITPQLGLLDGVDSIEHTVDAFGFQANTLEPGTLTDVVKTAAAGRPVIVGFRDPVTFPPGHILVVRGGIIHNGTVQTVFLADSSRLDYQKMSRPQFLHDWTGFAVLAVPK
jgi:hypothetical protein